MLDTPRPAARTSRVFAVLAWSLPLGVLLQAVVAGRAMFVTPELFGLHGGIGHGVLTLAILTAVWSWVGRVGRGTALLATSAVVLLVAQTGLGYSGRRSGVEFASVLHVPLGTAILGLTVSVAVLVSLHTRQQR